MGVLVRAARRFKSGSSDFGRPSCFRQTSHGERESVGSQAEGSLRAWKENAGLGQQQPVEEGERAEEATSSSKEEVLCLREELPRLRGSVWHRIEGAESDWAGGEQISQCV